MKIANFEVFKEKLAVLCILSSIVTIHRLKIINCVELQYDSQSGSTDAISPIINRKHSHLRCVVLSLKQR